MRGHNSKAYVLALLLVILVFNTVDRVALGILLQDIKADLRLSDTQLGFLTGIAFALFYSVMGIPLARWADRGNRVTIIAGTAGLWSIAVGLCGLASSFANLLLARVCVAVGEAGCIPAAQSLIADYYTRTERPRAIARYMLGIPLSYVVGYFLGGWLNELYGWRTTFLLLGAPGLALALLAQLTLKEPRRLHARTERPAPEHSSLQTDVISSVDRASLRDVCSVLWGNATFRHLLLCYSIASFFGYGVWQWKPAFFMRSYGLQTGEVGTWFAAIYGVAGLIGVYCGGELAFRRAASNEQLQVRVMAAMYAGFALISACMYLSPNHYVAFGLMALATLGINMAYGPLFALILSLVPDRIRAVSVAIVYLFANLIGMGLGPLAAGAVSDALRPWAGNESLRFSLLVLSPGYLWASWHLLRASRTVMADLEATSRAEQCSPASRGDASANAGMAELTPRSVGRSSIAE